MAEFSRSNLTGWTIRDIPLAPGDNQIEVIGFDGRGDEIDSDLVTVTSTFDRPALRITDVTPDSA